jgi:NADPH-dependent 2,4-dienoyl-CoA reductase/sulfur reductase-like enzyme
MQVVIVGASLSGLRTAQALRQRGFEGTIRLVGAEAHLPYDRPPLSKDLLVGARTAGEIGLIDPSQLERLALEVQLDTRALSVDLDNGAVRTTAGTVFYDHLVVATGAAPRLPGFARAGSGEPWPGVLSLRTLDDAERLAAVLRAGTGLAVVGAGFIGCEIASAARTTGCPVTVVEALPTPLFQSLGAAVGEVVAERARSFGVDLRCGVGATSLHMSDDKLEALVLADGSRVEAALVVVGVGVEPVTRWLDSSGLVLRDGLVCDAWLRALAHPEVHGVGDVVRWRHPVLERDVRVEHWTHASESAGHVAIDILGLAQEPYAPVAYVWSDQFGQRLQSLGLPEPADHFEIVHGTSTGRFVGLYRSGDELSGAAAVDFPGRLMRYRSLLERRTPWEQALELAAQLEP